VLIHLWSTQKINSCEKVFPFAFSRQRQRQQSTPPPVLYWNRILKGLIWHFWWSMTRGKDICDMCDTWYKFDNHEMCHTVTQCDTMTQKVLKNTKTHKICRLENEIDVTYCVTKRHCDTSVTPKVFNLCWLFKDGQRQGRGTYLFFIEHIVIVTPLLLQSWIDHKDL
jgi:hypothetical protein